MTPEPAEPAPATPAPIGLFVYNRPWHARRTVEALQRNHGAGGHDLVVFCDGARSDRDRAAVEEVRAFVRTIGGFRSVAVRERVANRGLAGSIIDGVGELLAAYGRVIVVEDDLVTSPHFLAYMDQALELYAGDEAVASIHGYIYPLDADLPETFFLRGADCWGWATWSRAWSYFEPDGAKLLAALGERRLLGEFDLHGARDLSGMLRRQIAGRNDSWAIRWHASAFLRGMVTLYPGRSLVDNIGNDASGTHSGTSSAFRVPVAIEAIRLARLPPVEDRTAAEAVARYFRASRGSGIGRWFRRLARRLHAAC
jgi:hypothetical protein